MKNKPKKKIILTKFSTKTSLSTPILSVKSFQKKRNSKKQKLVYPSVPKLIKTLEPLLRKRDPKRKLLSLTVDSKARSLKALTNRLKDSNLTIIKVKNLRIIQDNHPVDRKVYGSTLTKKVKKPIKKTRNFSIPSSKKYK